MAGEASGDELGAGLIREILQRFPDAVIEGIAGPKMVEAGCRALYATERLSVMGFIEVLGHLRELLKIRKHLFTYFKDQPPDIFIGIDAPDFNIPLEGKLRRLGIKTVHYVSPTIWAWRQGRVHTVAKNVDLMLTVFPFEADFYRQHEVAVRFVGHPLADSIPLVNDKQLARKTWGIASEAKVLTILPGSRASEIQRLGALFLGVAKRCHQHYANFAVVSPMVNQRNLAMFTQLANQVAPELKIHISQGNSQQAIAAADVVLTASGTATLETLLVNRPMIVAYKLSQITYWLVTKLRLMKISNFALPNLLAGMKLVPEFIQQDASVENLYSAIQTLLDNELENREINEIFTKIHLNLRKDASRQAADAVLALAPSS